MFRFGIRLQHPRGVGYYRRLSDTSRRLCQVLPSRESPRDEASLDKGMVQGFSLPIVMATPCGESPEASVPPSLQVELFACEHVIDGTSMHVSGGQVICLIKGVSNFALPGERVGVAQRSVRVEAFRCVDHGQGS